MYCSKCGKEIDDDSKFCFLCGAKTSEKTEITGHHKKESNVDGEKGSVDRYFFEENKCQYCGALRPLRKTHYYKNIGMLFIRRNQEIQGYFCKQCNNKLFIEYFFTDLFLGWWGIISFIITPFYLVFNLWSFIPTLWLQKEFNDAE